MRADYLLKMLKKEQESQDAIKAGDEVEIIGHFKLLYFRRCTPPYLLDAQVFSLGVPSVFEDNMIL